MIGVLFAIEEEKDMVQVAGETGLDEATLRETLGRLLGLGLIEPVAKKVRFLDRAFYDILKKHLTVFVGPMGEFILEDLMDEMGVSAERVPVHRAEELIRRAGEEIPDQGNRARFEQAMFKVHPGIRRHGP